MSFLKKQWIHEKYRLGCIWKYAKYFESMLDVRGGETVVKQMIVNYKTNTRPAEEWLGYLHVSVNQDYEILIYSNKKCFYTENNLLEYRSEKIVIAAKRSHPLSPTLCMITHFVVQDHRRRDGHRHLPLCMIIHFVVQDHHGGKSPLNFS